MGGGNGRPSGPPRKRLGVRKRSGARKEGTTHLADLPAAVLGHCICLTVSIAIDLSLPRWLRQNSSYKDT